MQDASIMFGIVMVSVFAGAFSVCLYDDWRKRRADRKLRNWMRDSSAQ